MVKVVIQLDELRCISQFDNGPSDASEPYLWLNFFFFDNVTATDSEPGLLRSINMLPGSSCRDLLPENIRAGTVIKIPALIGKFTFVLDDSVDIFKPAVGLIFVVIEENETSENLIVIGHQVFGEAIKDELNEVAKKLSFDLSEDEKKAIADRVQSRVFGAIEDNAGPLEFFRRKDRVIGFGSETYSWPILKLLLDKAPGLPYPIQERVRSERLIQLNPPFPPIKAVDEYEITGSIAVSLFVPPGADPCQAQKDALAEANRALEELDGELTDLQQRLRLSPPAEQARIHQQIRQLQAQRRVLVKQRDDASAAFGQCRIQHPGAPLRMVSEK